MFEKKFFLHAIRLAQSVKGSTSPNPAVGALIVKDGVIIAEGKTQPDGGQHAEAHALSQAGERARGADMYVTLEPCVYFPGKRTPACSTLIAEAGIENAYVGTRDPNPNINGKGISYLQKRGIHVELIESNRQELIEINEDYFKHITTGLPFVYAKYAMTLDGNIATSHFDSQWISNELSRERVHHLRNRVDAVMVGSGTAVHDNPRLNVRISGKTKDPLRVVIDPKGLTPPDYHLITDSQPSVFFVGNEAPERFVQACEMNRKKTVRLPAPFDLWEVLRILSRDFDVQSLLIEGGSKLLHRCMNRRIIDKLWVFIAPKVLGGSGIPPLNGEAPIKMAESIKLSCVSVENINDDILVRGYLNHEKQWEKAL